MSDRNTKSRPAGICEPGQAAAPQPSRIRRKEAFFRRAASLVLACMPRLGAMAFAGHVFRARQQVARPRSITASERDRLGPSTCGCDAFWQDVKNELLEFPQMRAAARSGRRSGALPRPRASVPALGSGRLAERLPALSERLFRIAAPVRVPSPGRHDWFIATALIAFFAIGWLAALASGGA